MIGKRFRALFDQCPGFLRVALLQTLTRQLLVRPCDLLQALPRRRVSRIQFEHLAVGFQCVIAGRGGEPADLEMGFRDVEPFLRLLERFGTLLSTGSCNFLPPENKSPSTAKYAPPALAA